MTARHAEGSEAAKVHLVRFTLGEHVLAFPIGHVREVLRVEGIVPVPGLPDFFRGVVNLRGQVATVLDLAKRLGIEDHEAPESADLMIVTDVGEAPVGVLVDSVPDVVQVPEDGIAKPPKKLRRNPAARYLTGICSIGDHLVMVLDLERLLDELGGEGVDVAAMVKDFVKEGGSEVTA